VINSAEDPSGGTAPPSSAGAAANWAGIVYCWAGSQPPGERRSIFPPPAEPSPEQALGGFWQGWTQAATRAKKKFKKNPAKQLMKVMTPP